VNNLCALAGYYCAAYVIDKPSVGRVKLQMISNIVCAITFVIAGVVFNSASSGVLMGLYFFSSYCVNFGPNVTTYVMAAESYPTELRGTLHGSK
jgi:sugar phosphate permease